MSLYIFIDIYGDPYYSIKLKIVAIATILVSVIGSMIVFKILKDDIERNG